MKTARTKLSNLKIEINSDIDSLTTEINNHIDKYGLDSCDYLTHSQQEREFYRGKLSGILDALALL